MAGKCVPSSTTSLTASALIRVSMNSPAWPLAREAGGEDQLAAGKHAGEIGDFADVHPAHPASEVTLTGEHLGLAALDRSRCDHGAQGGQHGYRV
jgi:hypothetical protein